MTILISPTEVLSRTPRKSSSHSIPLSLSFLSSPSRILWASRDSFFSWSLRNLCHSSSFAPFLTQSVKGVEESTSFFFFKTFSLLWSAQFYSLAFELYNRFGFNDARATAGRYLGYRICRRVEKLACCSCCAQKRGNAEKSLRCCTKLCSIHRFLPELLSLNHH